MLRLDKGMNVLRNYVEKEWYFNHIFGSLYFFKALTKFLKCVNWRLSGEVRQALDMLQQWSPMDVEDALELLSSNFTHPAVRRYAVSRLRQAPDEVVCLCNCVYLDFYEDKVTYLLTVL